MANRATLDFDPVRQRRVSYVEDGDDRYIVTEQNCKNLIEAAKAMSELPHNDKSMKPVAFIPDEVLNKAYLEGWFHDKAKWRAWVNDPDNRKFRITEGRL